VHVVTDSIWLIEQIWLDHLETFGKEKDGSHCDRWEFCYFCEVYGALYYIKTLKDMPDLKNVYKAITYRELK
jgi:hypothetical protein